MAHGILQEEERYQVRPPVPPSPPPSLPPPSLKHGHCWHGCHVAMNQWQLVVQTCMYIRSTRENIFMKLVCACGRGGGGGGECAFECACRCV